MLCGSVMYVAVWLVLHLYCIYGVNRACLLGESPITRLSGSALCRHLKMKDSIMVRNNVQEWRNNRTHWRLLVVRLIVLRQRGFEKESGPELCLGVFSVRVCHICAK